jgi:hypothetical protein
VIDKAVFRERTVKYFQTAGFTLVEDKKDQIIFKRGSYLSNFWTFNPLKWKSKICIELQDQTFTATFLIDATGQIITNKEEQLWDTFIENYQRFLTDKNFNIYASNKTAMKTTKSDSFKYVGWAALGGLILGLPAGLVGYWTGIGLIVPIAATVGAVAMLRFKINGEKG